MITRIRNYTGQELRVLTARGDVVIPVEGRPHVIYDRRSDGNAIYKGEHYINVNNITTTRVTGLPTKEPGTIVIVSAYVYSEIKDIRDDVYVVDEIMKEPGSNRVLGCKSFARKLTNL